MTWAPLFRRMDKFQLCISRGKESAAKRGHPSSADSGVLACEKCAKVTQCAMETAKPRSCTRHNESVPTSSSIHIMIRKQMHAVYTGRLLVRCRRGSGRRTRFRHLNADNAARLRCLFPAPRRRGRSSFVSLWQDLRVHVYWWIRGCSACGDQSLKRDCILS
jgi:hypothetical protein